ncbi:MAG: oxidoreductase [Candidatus Hydrogenedentota bacterium]
MDRVRVGFIGLGGICRDRHLPGLRRIPGVEIVAVANRTRESSERAAAEFEIPNVCDRWEDVIARDDVDAVFIGTWPYTHRDMSIAALEAGKHVFCQARMAMDYPQAKEMHEAARKSGRVAMVCPVPIGLTKDSTILRYVNSGRLGEVRLVRVQSMSGVFADRGTPMTWRKDHRLSGLNAFTLGMYIEVIHRWFGWTKTVSAMTQTFVKERTDTSGERVAVEIPDQILFNTELENGIPVQYVISAAVHHGTDHVAIHGSDWTLQYEVNEDVLYGAGPGERMGSATLGTDNDYDIANWPVERDFIDAIREGKEYHPNFFDGMKYMQVIQAVYDSAREGRTVELA